MLKDGDGLGLETLFGELAAADIPAAASSLLGVGTALQQSVTTQNELSTALVNARQALAHMADAAERYITVATASKLLRWAIDRYRDRKQGPMLAHASALFSQLTLGGFRKLTVDYEHQPPALSALRPTGPAVEVMGMSEGTRDQLYLALRLAALELHLEQAEPLPFIADDLFVNFDDARAKAGLQALAELSRRTQVIFLSHHNHLVPMIHDVFGANVNVVSLH